MSEIDRRTVGQILTENTVSANRPSTSSRQVMLRLGLADHYQRDPEAALAELHALAMQELVDDRLFALAEYSYLYAVRQYHECRQPTGNPRDRRPQRASDSATRPECERARAYFMATAIYAYAFLFPESGHAAPSRFDPRLRTAADLYNLAVTSAIEARRGAIAPGVRSHRFHLGTLELELPAEELRYAERQLEDFVPAAQLAVRGLRNRYRRPGIGAPFVASAVVPEGASVPVRSARVPKRAKVPITVLVRLDDVEAGLRSGALRGRIEIYSEAEASEVEIAGQRVPLEYETTSTLAYGLARSPLWGFGLAGFRDPEYLQTLDALSSSDGLIMWEPYKRGRIPVVLVHGTASSPAWWAEMLNEMLSDPILRSRYQFWFFIYSTGNPILYSASRLRNALGDAVSELDPTGRDAALRRMVLIGHSQGGLLVKLQAIASGTRFWENISDKPLAEIPLEPATRETLEEALFFEPQSFVERVIFISTPHRGSFLAGGRLGRFASSLVHTPGNLLRASGDLANAGIGLASSAVKRSRSFFDLFSRSDEGARLQRKLSRLPSSVDNMEPDSPFTLTLQSLPIDSRIHAHSIIPVLGGPPPDDQNDGVVAYQSAHIDGVESEFIVYHSGHSTQGNPDTIQETRRILLEHLETP
ncbi:MAG TPA: hypothetical protein VEC18_05870 [Myxococcota bacterium]|nr:hypothetical protein [Myxococcota bacterium]